MATTTRTLDANVNGVVYTGNANGALEALDTCHSGATAPTDEVANGKFWLDTSTTPSILKMYDNATWNVVVNATNVTEAGAVMDSELTAPASVKGLDQGVATTDSPAFVGLTVNGNNHPSAGAFSNRNILINGNLTVNQRGLSIASVSTGAYGEDRWKKTAGGMTQIIEEVNYLPSTVYTLSGTGVTTQQITSPASGDWTLPDIPVTARLIQLELGDTATPFEHRSYGDELQRCQRYYQKYSNGSNSASSAVAIGQATGSGTVVGSIIPPVSFRAKPTISGVGYGVWTAAGSSGGGTSLSIGAGSNTNHIRVGVSGATLLVAGNASGIQLTSGIGNYIALDAEL